MSTGSFAVSLPSRLLRLRSVCTRGVLAAVAASILGAALPSVAAADPWRLAIQRAHDDDDGWQRRHRGHGDRHGWRDDRRHGHGGRRHAWYDDRRQGWDRPGWRAQRYPVAPRRDACPPRSYGPPYDGRHRSWGSGWAWRQR